MYPINSIRKDFRILSSPKLKGLVYLDNTATSQKPQQVISSIKDFYERYNANIHRGLYQIAEEATEKFEESRKVIAEFINASKSEIVFTSGATASLNLVALSWGRKNIRRKDNIVVTGMEHHSNFLPWQEIARSSGAELRVAPIEKDGMIDMGRLLSLIDERTKVLSLTHASNVLGTINPVEEIIVRAKRAMSYDGIVVVDGAQALPHLSVDVKKLNCDFYAFSGHKMLAPTGVGVLYGKREILENMPPLFTGGHMVKNIKNGEAEWSEIPQRFEAGTANISGVIALSSAVSYLQKVRKDGAIEYEKELTEYALKKTLWNQRIRTIRPYKQQI